MVKYIYSCYMCMVINMINIKITSNEIKITSK